jgi:hypothetical protein
MGNLRGGDGPCPSSPSGNIGGQDGRVEERDHFTHFERDRKPARGIQAADQDANRPAERGNRGDVVLGIARFRLDRDAQSRWLAEPRREAFRSAD